MPNVIRKFMDWTCSFPNINWKKIKEYENENNFWCDTELPSKVFRQYNGYWVPDNQALLNHFLKDEAKKSSTSFPKGAGACVESLTSIAGNPYGVGAKPHAPNPVGVGAELHASQVGQTTELFDEPERFVFESWEIWVDKTLEPYKHKFDSGTRFQSSNFLTNTEYRRALEKVKSKTDIFARFSRVDSVKRLGWNYDLIYLETAKKSGPCWAPK
jgi:hypothetical protein